MSMFETVADAVWQLVPEGWGWTPYEEVEELPDVTTLSLKIRNVTRLPGAPQGAYQVEWVLTITSPYPQRERADSELADDLLQFLHALDEPEGPSWLAWTSASKVTASDYNDRLAYDITLTTITQKEA